MAPIINIHTHHNQKSNSREFNLKNIILSQQEIPKKGFYSSGWHPWFIRNNTLFEIEKKLEISCTLQQIIAIGECGLDRAINTPIEVQQKVFQMHLELACRLNKPVIIHAVRAYSDILQTLKKMNFQLPVIFHDYRGNSQQTKEILNFNSYFSFGASIVKPQFAQLRLKEIPVDRLFLETDESLLSIEKIYLSAASVLEIPFEKLTKQIYNNFKTIFGDGLVE